MAEKADAQATYWQRQIDRAEKDKRYRRWLDIGHQFYERYLLESDGQCMSSTAAGVAGISTRMIYNLLWSNVQTIKPMLYSKLPEPYVSRKFGNRDPIARMAAQLIERATMTDLEFDDFDDQADRVALDYLITARGTLRGIYESTVVNSRIPVRQEDLEPGEPRFVTEEGTEIPADAVRQDGGRFFVLDPQTTDERAPLMYHNWKDFLVGPGRNWAEVQKHGWITWITYMDKGAASRRFGKDVANRLTYNVDPFDVVTDKNTEQRDKPGESQHGRLARINETWDARSRKIYWTSPGYDRLLDDEDDFLDLNGFFNTPRPLLATMGNDSMVPVPDYAEYYSQAKELDDITKAIEQITEEIRAGGIYDLGVPNLGTFLKNKAGGWHGVDNWQKLAASGGIDGAIQQFDTQALVNAAAALYEHRKNVKRDADELSGMIDLFRGQQTQEDETLGQSRIRAGMGGLRINDRQRDFQRYLGEALQIKAEIIAKQFAPERIVEMADEQALIEESPQVTRIRAMMQSPQAQQIMSNPQMAQQAMAAIAQVGQAMRQAVEQQRQLIGQGVALLKNDRMRTFRLSIGTDATVAIDEAEEKAQAGEFVNTVGGFLERVLGSEAIQSTPELKGLAAEMLMFVVRKFKIGRSLEQKIEETVKNLATAPQQQQQPDPLTLDVQRQAQADQQDFQVDQQKNQIDAFEAATARMKAETDARLAVVKAVEAAQKAGREDLRLAKDILEGDTPEVAGNA